VVDADVLPGGLRPDGRRKELAVGPVKSSASKAILSLPPSRSRRWARHHQRQARLRLAGTLPATVRCAGSSPASHPTRESWTWSGPSGAAR
jgi:hypothetical protein